MCKDNRPKYSEKQNIKDDAQGFTQMEKRVQEEKVENMERDPWKKNRKAPQIRRIRYKLGLTKQIILQF